MAGYSGKSRSTSYSGQRSQGAGFNLDDYIPINLRIIEFYERYPEGTIQTEVLALGPEDEKGYSHILFKAYAYRYPNDPRPATGHAHEWREDSRSVVNATSSVENAESSAVGRALANLGIEVSKSIASREEVERARRQQEEMKDKDKSAVKVAEEVVGTEETAKQRKLFGEVKKLHEQLGATDDEQKRALLVKSGVADSFTDMGMEQIEAYRDFLKAEAAASNDNAE